MTTSETAAFLAEEDAIGIFHEIRVDTPPAAASPPQLSLRLSATKDRSSTPRTSPRVSDNAAVPSPSKAHLWTDFTSRHEVLEDILLSEVQRSSAAHALAASSRDLVRRIQNDVAWEVSNNTPVASACGDAVSRSSSQTRSAISLVDFVQSQGRKDAIATIADLTTQMKQLKRAVGNLDVEIDDRLRKLEAFRSRNRMSVLLEKESRNVEANLDSLISILKTRLQLLLGALDRLENEKAKQTQTKKSDKSTVTKLREQSVELKSQLDDKRRELTSLQRSVAKLFSKPPEETVAPPTSPPESPRATDESELRDMRERLAVLRGQAQMLRLLQRTRERRAASIPAASPSPPEEDEQRRAQANLQQMMNTMSFLKATIINFACDLKRIRQLQGVSNPELETRFKAAHNEIKIALGFVVVDPEERRLMQGRCELWPVTPALIEDNFPTFKLDTVTSALKDMVITWDCMSKDSKLRMTTAQDVVLNSHILLVLALYLTRRTRKRKSIRLSTRKIRPHLPSGRELGASISRGKGSSMADSLAATFSALPQGFQGMI